MNILSIFSRPIMTNKKFYASIFILIHVQLDVTAWEIDTFVFNHRSYAFTNILFFWLSIFHQDLIQSTKNS